MKRGRFLICGLGNFGSNLARRLFEQGQEVIAIDIDEKKIAETRDYASEAVVANASEREALEQIGLGSIDAAVISLGETRIDTSVLATLHLKDLGIKRIIVKTISPEHARIVERIGATEVIFPEKEAAIRLADKLSTPHVFEQVSLHEGYSLVEMMSPRELWNKTLMEASIRSKYNITIVWINRKTPDGKEISIVPRPDDRVMEGDVLFVLGEQKAIEGFKKLKT
ncbi:MAG: potassium channel family protein [Deltaproteobacteria bacterium]